MTEKTPRKRGESATRPASTKHPQNAEDLGARPPEEDIPIAEIISVVDLEAVASVQVRDTETHASEASPWEELDLSFNHAAFSDLPLLPPWPIPVLTLIVIALFL